MSNNLDYHVCYAQVEAPCTLFTALAVRGEFILGKPTPIQRSAVIL